MLCRNLCDTRGLGKLNTEQFALAMYLIQQKVKGIEPPQTLPPDMIPPSMRQAVSSFQTIKHPALSVSCYKLFDDDTWSGLEISFLLVLGSCGCYSALKRNGPHKDLQPCRPFCLFFPMSLRMSRTTIAVMPSPRYTILFFTFFALRAKTFIFVVFRKTPSIQQLKI